MKVIKLLITVLWSPSKLFVNCLDVKRNEVEIPYVNDIREIKQYNTVIYLAVLPLAVEVKRYRRSSGL